jgi:OmpA-OmpF porin, OOP family
VKKFVIAASLALVSATALADENRGFYMNGNFGQSQFDVSQEELDAIALAAFEDNGLIVQDADSSLDDSGSAWSISGGWRFSRYIAVEVGYLDLGSSKYAADGTVFVPTVGVVPAATTIDISVEGPTVAAVAFAPIGEKFDVHGRLGMLFADTTFDFGVSLGNVTETDDFSSSSEDFFGSIGGAYHFTPNLAASLDYSLFSGIGDEDSAEGDVDSITLGLQYTF